MKTRRFVTPLALVGLVACSSTTPESPQQTVRSTEPALVDLAGTWAFDLQASDVVAGFRKECAEKSKGDAKAEASCFDEIERQARREKIRLAPVDSDGRSRWTSFEVDENAKETVYVDVPVVISKSDDHLLMTVAGKATGQRGEQFSKTTERLRIDIIDARHISGQDPKKGKLVYAKE